MNKQTNKDTQAANSPIPKEEKTFTDNIPIDVHSDADMPVDNRAKTANTVMLPIGTVENTIPWIVDLIVTDDGFTLNSDQTTAIYAMMNWATYERPKLEGSRKADPDSPKRLTFTLRGWAGSGKSTIIKEFLQQCSNHHIGGIAVTAPTHKAKTVIRATTGKYAMTIQKLLGLRPDTDVSNFDPNKPTFNPIGEPDISKQRLIIIDEASMLNSSLYQYLIDQAEIYSVRLLFVGDALQLPPVGEFMSRAFTSRCIQRI